jgi:hypothetical protein
MAGMSMGKKRPVHKRTEHVFQEDGWCPCGRWKLKGVRGPGSARTTEKMNLDVIEKNNTR